ncbi:MAG: phosphodiester glycosidase family protein [Armatimonadota bacterium]
MCKTHITKIIATTIILVSALAVNSVSAHKSVALEYKKVNGAQVRVVTVNLKDPTVKVDIGLPSKGISHSESFVKMVYQHQPIAAVTGTYFCTKTLTPVGSIVSNGKLIHKANVGSAVAFNYDGEAKIVPLKKGQNHDWNGVITGLRTGPLLLSNGSYALNPKDEGYRDPGLFGRKTRMALGITSHNKLLLVAVQTPVTFGQSASIMKKLGAVEALCLDGGSSSAMYYKGKMILRPQRSLTNLLEIRKVPDYMVKQKLSNSQYEKLAKNSISSPKRSKLTLSEWLEKNKPVNDNIFSIYHSRLKHPVYDEINTNSNFISSVKI